MPPGQQIDRVCSTFPGTPCAVFSLTLLTHFAFYVGCSATTDLHAAIESGEVQREQ